MSLGDQSQDQWQEPFYGPRDLTRMVYEGQPELAGSIAKYQHRYAEFLSRLTKVHRRLTYQYRRVNGR